MPSSAVPLYRIREMAQSTNEENLIPYQYYTSEAECNIEIKKSKLGGRGLFACRPIKQGSLIFANKPLVVGPRADCTGVFCSVCYISSDSCYPCEKCQINICSEECKFSPDHVKLCNFVIDNWKIKSNPQNNLDISNILIYLHFLILSENKKSILKIYQKDKTKNIQNQIKSLENFKNIIPPDQITFIHMIEELLKVNSFRIANSVDNKKIPLRGFYPLSAFLNHCCVPNTRNIFRTDYEMAVYATKDIAAGEEILTCYTGLLWCTPARRVQLYKTKRFWCTCSRCQDNTERGTNLSAVKCLLRKDCVGVLLPIQPTNPTTDWKCDMCHANVSSEQISTIHSVLGSLVGTIDLDDQFRLESLVLERLAKFVPYSNQIFVDLRFRLAVKLGFADGLKLNGI
ncbi:hypothetical protein O3G_MSEX010378 [Manduca sexta]|uniref:SET domain-containing protein n=1 Tax=Manduca sexta TaxID=7130 RepID=A0A921ZGX6_MANSE|nr:hypothetical protein O3G_MSEX010378 [Manduca sexta]